MCLFDCIIIYWCFIKMPISSNSFKQDEVLSSGQLNVISSGQLNVIWKAEKGGWMPKIYLIVSFHSDFSWLDDTAVPCENIRFNVKWSFNLISNFFFFKDSLYSGGMYMYVLITKSYYWYGWQIFLFLESSSLMFLQTARE